MAAGCGGMVFRGAQGPVHCPGRADDCRSLVRLARPHRMAGVRLPPTRRRPHRAANLATPSPRCAQSSQRQAPPRTGRTTLGRRAGRSARSLTQAPARLSWMWPRCRTRRDPRVPRDLLGRLTDRIGRRDQHNDDRDRRHQHAGAHNDQPATECHARRRGSRGAWRVGAIAGYSAPDQTSLPRTHGASTSTAPTAWTRPPAPSPNQARCTIRCPRPGRRADPPLPKPRRSAPRSPAPPTSSTDHSDATILGHFTRWRPDAVGSSIAECRARRTA